MVKIAINGFGRIGRLAFRRMWGDKDFEIVAINDLSSTANLAYLLKYDSAHGVFPHEVSSDEENIIVDGKKIHVYKIKDPKKEGGFPWKSVGAEVILECTGHYLTKEASQSHIDGGAKGVVLSAPAKDDTLTYVYGVNTGKLESDVKTGVKVISGASCTTNCLAPVLKVIEDNYGVDGGYMTTVHAYTNDQTNLDLIKEKDFRRGRAAAQNIVPTSTGAAKAIDLVIPSLHGRLQGGAIRVPVLDGSLVDVTLNLKKEVVGGAAEINKLMKEASEGELKDVLGYSDDALVSRDILGRTEGSIFNSDQTKVFKTPDGTQLVKVFSWYDNEYSYTCQYVRLAKLFGELLSK
ncbi:MAG: type I glyceraldehyde-3-phosphate dehydrogenase [Candidatus Enterosoma sp.]|nr:type I glyceraldehyde-3-phosphate dehydrogenase [Candidatus Enterosoma sp.]